MGNPVMVNSRPLIGKASMSMTVAFPDVCMTPPQTPFTPIGIPIPYPNIGKASDTAQGSTSVSMHGKPLTLMGQSNFSTSIGDEAGSAPKKGIVSSKTKGTCFFVACSFDVLANGKPTVRGLDPTVNNALQMLCNTPPMPHIPVAA